MFAGDVGTSQSEKDHGLNSQSQEQRPCGDQSEQRVALVLPYYCMKFE